MSVTIPFTFTGGAGNKARASEVNSNFQSIASKFTEGSGGISDGDIATTAGIKAAKLSAVPGNRITQAQMDDDAVDLRVLKDDATPGSPLAAVNNANHIKDGIITNAKLVDGTVKKGKLNMPSVLVTIPTIVAGARANVDTTLTLTGATPAGWFIETTGAVGGPAVTLTLYLDTSANKYFISAVNTGNVSGGDFSVRVYYLTI